MPAGEQYFRSSVNVRNGSKADIPTPFATRQSSTVLAELAINENKTRATSADVDRLLDSIADPQKREDARTVCAMMRRLSGEDSRVWGANMVGFGSYRYRYDSGRQGEWFITGFAPQAGEWTRAWLTPGS